MKEKKQSDVAVLLRYAGNYRGLTFLGLGLSAVAMVLGMAPYICIWLAARDLVAVAPNWTAATNIGTYGRRPASSGAWLSSKAPAPAGAFSDTEKYVPQGRIFT